MQVLTDTDVDRLATPAVVTDAMRRAVVAAWEGHFVAPPRTQAQLADRRLVFTCGQVPGDWFGYRSYVAPGSQGDEQVVVLQDEATGAVRGIAKGGALGPRRVGGLGAVAADALAPEDPRYIAVIGAGIQAWHQMWALPERLRHLPIRVSSRTVASRDAFVARLRDELGLDASAATDPAAAARGAGMVVLATSSPAAVLTGADIEDGAFVTTLGPKQVGRAEFGPDLVERAGLVVSDSPAQISAYDPPNVLAGTGVEDRIAHLGAVVSGTRPVVPGTRVFLSVGLAGTEAWLLAELLRL